MNPPPPHRAALLAAAALASAAVTSRAAPVASASPTLALIVASDPPGAAASCAPVARAVASVLGARGADVTLLIDSSITAARGALYDLATRIAASPLPPPALLYVCAPATFQDGRLFVLPGVDAGRNHDALTQGVVLTALPNALGGSSNGAVLADLVLQPWRSPPPLQALAPGLRLAIHLDANGHSTPAGDALATTADAAHAWAEMMIARGPDSHAVSRQDRWIVIPVAVPPATPPPTSPTLLPSRTLATALPPLPPTPPPVPPSPATIQTAAGSTAVATATAPPKTIATRAETPSGRATPAAEQTRRSPRPPRTHQGPGNARFARLQGALARHGLYHGPIDGRLDPPTTDAIRAFQRSLGEEGTGVLTAGQIVLLLNS